MKSTYKNVEYIIVENNSEEERTFEYYKKMEAENPKVKVVKWEKEDVNKRQPYKSAIAAIDLRVMDLNLNKIKLWLLKHRKYRSVFLY